MGDLSPRPLARRHRAPNRRIIPRVFVGTVVVWLASATAVPAVPRPDLVCENLRTRIENAGIPPKIIVQKDMIHASLSLPLFYERRAYRSAWTDDGRLLPQVDDLINAIEDAGAEGLTPEDYHLLRIEETLRQIRRSAGWGAVGPARLADLDLLLTDAFLVYAAHLLGGRINPETLDPEWQAYRREVDLVRVLQDALESGTVRESLRSVLPVNPGYARLKEALAEVRRAAATEEWPAVPDGPKLERGSSGERVVLLRQRLGASGDLPASSGEDDGAFDDALDRAVRRFQARHGLDVDGVVGRATRAALNVLPETRARQIVLNMERWRWLPQDFGRRYILINVADFSLEVVEGEHPVMSMRVVVGRQYRRTPVFSDNMTYLVLNPSWYVPANIAGQDILPKIQENPEYLSRQRIRVFRGSGSEAPEVDPATVEWSQLRAQTLPYTFRQDPGPENALGRVKFMFPNRFNVYLHDTPAPDLFTKTTRAFSSGCIRVEKPIELAAYVLGGNPAWTREALVAAIRSGETQTVRLPQPIPVHLVYWTAWVDGSGVLQFREDVYGRDRVLDEALREKPPSS